jgi:hypothetical protein
MVALPPVPVSQSEVKELTNRVTEDMAKSLEEAAALLRNDKKNSLSEQLTGMALCSVGLLQISARLASSARQIKYISNHI